jgi:hypothetical protein
LRLGSRQFVDHAFDLIPEVNPWGSKGDLRLLADPQARYRVWPKGAATPMDFVMSDIVELDGAQMHLFFIVAKLPTIPRQRSSVRDAALYTFEQTASAASTASRAPRLPRPPASD